jgi:zinc transporter 1
MANSSSRLVWSKSTRIKVMIAIDTAFFLLELICGFLAHSLALTADAFHMVRCAIASPFLAAIWTLEVRGSSLLIVS